MIFFSQLEDDYDITFSTLPNTPQSEPETVRISDALVLNFPKTQVSFLSPSIIKLNANLQSCYTEHTGQNFPPDPEAIKQYRLENPKVIINVGGTKFEVIFDIL